MGTVGVDVPYQPHQSDRCRSTRSLGVGLIVIAITGASLTSSAQAGVASWLEDRLQPVVEWLAPIPDWLVAVGLVAFAVAAVSVSGRSRKPLPQESNDDERNCHGQQDEAAASAGSEGAETH